MVVYLEQDFFILDIFRVELLFFIFTYNVWPYWFVM